MLRRQKIFIHFALMIQWLNNREKKKTIQETNNTKIEDKVQKNKQFINWIAVDSFILFWRTNAEGCKMTNEWIDWSNEHRVRTPLRGGGCNNYLNNNYTSQKIGFGMGLKANTLVKTLQRPKGKTFNRRFIIFCHPIDVYGCIAVQIQIILVLL